LPGKVGYDQQLWVEHTAIVAVFAAPEFPAFSILSMFLAGKAPFSWAIVHKFQRLQ